jgi:hypothetical protein
MQARRSKCAVAAILKSPVSCSAGAVLFDVSCFVMLSLPNAPVIGSPNGRGYLRNFLKCATLHHITGLIATDGRSCHAQSWQREHSSSCTTQLVSYRQAAVYLCGLLWDAGLCITLL